MAVELLTYADETGTQGNPAYCLVAGLIGSPRQWRLFDAAWNRVLGTYGVQEFHSTDFFHRKYRREASTNPFRGWTDERAHQFLTDLLTQALLPRRLTPVGGAVNVPIFNSYTKAERRYFTNAQISQDGAPVTTGAPSRPYQLGLVTLLFEAAEASRSDARVHFIMDINNNEESLALQSFRDIVRNQSQPVWARLGEMRFARSDQEPGLQIADLYAYVWQRFLFRQDQGRPLGREEAYAIGAFNTKRRVLKVWTESSLDLLLGKLSPEQRRGLKAEL